MRNKEPINIRQAPDTTVDEDLALGTRNCFSGQNPGLTCDPAITGGPVGSIQASSKPVCRTGVRRSLVQLRWVVM